MTREEAAGLIAAHFRKHRIEQPGLNKQGAAGALIAGEQLLFEHDANSGALRCSALIYRFREQPFPGLIEAMREVAKQPAPGTGGAGLVYRSDHMSLSLARQYTQVPPASVFEEDQAELRQACTRWRQETFATVAEQVRHGSRG